MATSPPTGQPSAQPIPFGVRVQQFWHRVTEGLQVSQLWSQFESEARASYRLYSKDVAAKTPEGLTDRGRRLHVVKEFFWAVFEKLSPARRVLLLLALILLVMPGGGFEYTAANGKVQVSEFNTHFWSALVLLLLLMLEIADRVVMKRDLQIAREIQTWLLPGVPPQIPGLAIAYATRPANTVAGDYYDVFPRPGKDVVIISRDGIGWTRRICDGKAWNLRRDAGKQPGLNLSRNLQVALHHHAVGNLEHQQQKQNQCRPEVGIEFADLDFSVCSRVLKPASGHNQQNQCEQQQDSARRRELLKYRPEKFLDDMKAAAAVSESLRRFGRDIFRVQSVAGPRFGFELRPQLADLKALRHSMPELLYTHAERDWLRRRLSSGRRGGHVVQLGL